MTAFDHSSNKWILCSIISFRQQHNLCCWRKEIAQIAMIFCEECIRPMRGAVYLQYGQRKLGSYVFVSETTGSVRTSSSSFSRGREGNGMCFSFFDNGVYLYFAHPILPCPSSADFFCQKPQCSLDCIWRPFPVYPSKHTGNWRSANNHMPQTLLCARLNSSVLSVPGSKKGTPKEVSESLTENRKKGHFSAP